MSLSKHILPPFIDSVVTAANELKTNTNNATVMEKTSHLFSLTMFKQTVYK